MTRDDREQSKSDLKINRIEEKQCSERKWYCFVAVVVVFFWDARFIPSDTREY